MTFAHMLAATLPALQFPSGADVVHLLPELIEGGVEGAGRLCGRILQLFSSLHLAQILTVLVTSLPGPLTPERTAELVAKGRTLEAGAVHVIGE